MGNVWGSMCVQWIEWDSQRENAGIIPFTWGGVALWLCTYGSSAKWCLNSRAPILHPHVALIKSFGLRMFQVLLSEEWEWGFLTSFLTSPVEGAVESMKSLLLMQFKIYGTYVGKKDVIWGEMWKGEVIFMKERMASCNRNHWHFSVPLSVAQIIRCTLK